MGIALAVLAVAKRKNGQTLAQVIDLSGRMSLGNLGGLLFFALLLGSIVWACLRSGKKRV